MMYHAENILVGSLRESLGYRSRAGIEKIWSIIFTGETLPDDHAQISIEQARQFLLELSQSKRGRSADITVAAKAMLRNFDRQNGNGQPQNLADADAETIVNTIEKMLPPGNNETPVQTTPPPPNPSKQKSAIAQFATEFIDVFHPADLVFYGVVGIGCVGVMGTLPGIGIVIAALWFSVALLALHRCKTIARIGDFVFLVFIEIIVGSLSHIAWANKLIWENVKSLPIEVYINRFRDGDNQLVLLWQGDVEIPFYVACYVAFMLISFGGYAVAVSVLAIRKRLKSANK